LTWLLTLRGLLGSQVKNMVSVRILAKTYRH
jgi:hypothetical protein